METVTIKPETQSPPIALTLVACLVVAVLAGLVGFSMGTGTKSDPQAEARKVLTQLRSVYALPEQPEPSVAQISDVEEMRKKEKFFEKASNGDWLVITADRAILFDPESGKVLDMVPVQAAQPPAPTK